MKDFSDTNIVELQTIESSFRVSLEFQTKLFETVCKIEESKNSQKRVYIPSQEYFDAVDSLFEINQEHLSLLENMPILKSGDFHHLQTKLADNPLDYNLFKTFKIKTPKERILFLSPCRHIDVLYSFAYHMIKNSESKSVIEKFLQENAHKQLQKTCRRFFTVRGSLIGLYETKSQNNLTKNADFSGVVDGGKILLFKLLPINISKETDQQLIEAMSDVHGIIRELKKDDWIGLRYADNPQKILAVPTSIAEIFTIYVIPRLTLEPLVLRRPKDLSGENNFIVVLGDLQRVFEHISSPLAFVKFMRDDNELKKNSRTLSMDFLDRFIYYIDNGNSFSRQGRPFNFILFQPHSWSDYYTKKLYEKSKDEFYGLIEIYFSDYFNEIETKGEGIYALSDTSTLTSAYATMFNKGIIIAFLPPDGYFCTGEEIKYSEFLAHFYIYYFNKFKHFLVDYFENHEIHLDKLYGISVVPATYIKRQNLRHLISLADKISEENPIEIMTGRVKQTLNLRTAVVFDFQHLPVIFSQRDNQGERDVFRKLLISILKYLTPSFEALESEVGLLIDGIMPVGSRAFSLDEIPLDNPKAERYRNHDEPTGSDIARVQRKIAEHIAVTNFKPGEYEGERAISILESSFDFISNLIENELKAYNQSVAYYAFEQLEFIEYERAELSIRSGIDSSKYVEYDVESRFVEEYYKISKAAISVKYLCTNVIKLAPHGIEAVDRESWDNILALAYSAVELSYLIDLLRYDLKKHVIKINEMYEISHNTKMDSYDLHGFAQVEAKNKISSAKERIVAYGKRQKKNYDEIVQDVFYTELDKLFLKEYKFKFMDLICVLFALGKYNGKSYAPSFVNECDKEALMEFLEGVITVDCPPREILDRIIDFISMGKKSFDKGKIIPTQLFREKRRINLCPLYYKEGTYIFGNQICIEAAKFWTSTLVGGEFPYSLKKDSEIEKFMTSYRSKLDKELEKEAEVIVKNVLGEDNYEANILNFTRLSKLFPKRPECGEIDILAVNRKTKTLFLFDAKNRKRSITPHGIRFDIDEFLKGKQSYLAKIIKKERFIKSNIEEVLNHFSVTCADGWKFKKAFVVRRNYQVAHYYKKSIDFVEVNDLAGYLAL